MHCLGFFRFKTKYHPKDSAARQKELQKAMRKRLGIFLELIKSERAEKVVLDIDHTEAIVKFLDASKNEQNYQRTVIIREENCIWAQYSCDTVLRSQYP